MWLRLVVVTQRHIGGRFVLRRYTQQLSSQAERSKVKNNHTARCLPKISVRPGTRSVNFQIQLFSSLIMLISARLAHEFSINSAKTCQVEIFHDDLKRLHECVCVCVFVCEGERDSWQGGSLSPAKLAGNRISAPVHSGPVCW